MLSGVDGGGVPVDVTAGRDLVGAAAPACPASPAEQALLDWLGLHLALESRLGYDGTAGWKHRSVYELVAAYGRWFIPAALPADVRALPERQCFANAAATEREHPHLAYTEGFAVADSSPVPAAHAWCRANQAALEPASARSPQLGCPGSTRLPVPAVARRPVSRAVRPAPPCPIRWRAACVHRRPGLRPMLCPRAPTPPVAAARPPSLATRPCRPAPGSLRH
jgi:hypothetical protein